MQLSPWLPKLKIQITPKIRKDIKERGQGKEITKKMVKIMPDGRLKTTVQGGKDLKQTQCYPRGFGVKVARLHCSWIDARHISLNMFMLI